MHILNVTANQCCPNYPFLVFSVRLIQLKPQKTILQLLLFVIAFSCNLFSKTNQVFYLTRENSKSPRTDESKRLFLLSWQLHYPNC